MIRVVLDTNVVVSSLLAAGPSQAIPQLAFNDKFALFVTKPIIAEYKQVFAYPRLRIEPRDARRAIAAIRRHSELLTPTFVLAQAVEEEDNRFLECAQAA